MYSIQARVLTEVTANSYQQNNTENTSLTNNSRLTVSKGTENQVFAINLAPEKDKARTFYGCRKGKDVPAIQFPVHYY